ncbi:hypothetical protein H6F67_10355 [Microcoleus sp. FACHB-1515]|uniref:hypothetical protein n=1 Tax=Cyanophyceae TaxID=3028117 RepID=UPI0016842BBB|nr:hypothetical protein [Microcoleus sp. FACHB-1515]MBD2090254.1 hypothetical protein [Microcoleus sp. FACHB-1515]
MRILGWRRAIVSVMAIALCFTLWACGGDRPPVAGKGEPTRLGSRISEVAPPAVIEELRSELEQYQPQVSIVSPRPDEVLDDNQVTVKFRVQDLPLFKNAALGLGPHLHVFLDNQPYQAVYDADGSIEFTDLTPGTHTIRAFASRPWHESFKNEGAYAQTTFHVFTKTPNNNPDPNQPLLTYSRPQASYGAEPIMLDFYLTNAPLHLIAQEDPNDDIPDWRVRATVNGQSFEIDRWQPVYLKGFKPGKNWVQLEYLDEQGNPIVNAFNNTVRLITYEPGGSDTLSKIVRGDVDAATVRGIVDRTYQPPAPEPEPIPEPTPEPSPGPEEVFEPEPEVVEPEETIAPEVEPTPEPEVAEPSIEPVEPAPTNVSPTKDNEPIEPSVTPAPVVEPAPSSELPPVEPVQPRRGWKEFLKRGGDGYFNRRGRPPGAAKAIESAPQTLPEIIEPESIEPDVPLILEPTGEPEVPILRSPEPAAD